ncbi:MAG: hypothetical protein JOZ47_23115 [Kutzneria sp.]|nr:hypothetical protein [Kutzneria sp.]
MSTTTTRLVPASGPVPVRGRSARGSVLLRILLLMYTELAGPDPQLLSPRMRSPRPTFTVRCPQVDGNGS